MADPFSSLLKMISALLLVLGIILLIAYGARVFLRSRFSRWRRASPIHVLSTTYLGPKKEVSVIEVGQEFLVLGVTPNQISLLAHLKRDPFQSFQKPEEMEDLEAS